MKEPLFEFIQKMSQAPYSSVQALIWEHKLDYLKNPSLGFKNSAYESLAMLEGKTTEGLFF